MSYDDIGDYCTLDSCVVVADLSTGQAVACVWEGNLYPHWGPTSRWLSTGWRCHLLMRTAWRALLFLIHMPQKMNFDTYSPDFPLSLEVYSVSEDVVWSSDGSRLVVLCLTKNGEAVASTFIFKQ